MSTGTATINHDRKLIGSMLLDEGIIERNQLKRALEVQSARGGKIVETLIHLGYIDFTTISNFLATRPGIASIELENYLVPRELCDLIPREYATKNEVFPIDRMGNSLTVAMAFPIDMGTIQEIENMTEMRVSALLCHAHDIRSAIRRYYPDESTQESQTDLMEKIEAALKMESIVNMVRQIDTLPTLPTTVQRVQEATADPDSSLRDIAYIVSNDPPISARLLQLANSAAYGFLSRIDNVRSAITLLGMRETYMAVLSSAVIDITEQSSKFDHQHYWRYSMFCASAARRIAAACGRSRKAGVFTAGLLSDIGRFALAELAGDRYARIDQTLSGAEFARAEEATLGIGHPEAGHILAIHWRLPDEIANAIRFHHRPELAQPDPEMATMIALASIMAEAHMLETQPDQSIFDGHEQLLKTLNIDLDKATDAYAAARAADLNAV